MDLNDKQSENERRMLLEHLSEDKGLFESVDYARVGLLFRKNIIWIILIIGACLTGSHLLFRYTKPVFESSSVLKLDVKSDAGMLGLQVHGQQPQNLNDLSGEIEIIKSKLIYNEVIKKVGLRVSYFERGQILIDEKYRNNPFEIKFDESIGCPFQDQEIEIIIKDYQKYILKYPNDPASSENSHEHSFGDSVSIEGFEFVILPTLQLTSMNFGKEFFFVIHSQSYLTDFIGENLSVRILNLNANTIEVSFKDYNRYKTRDIVNAINNVYLHTTLAKKRKVQEQTIQFIDSQLDSTEQRLRDAEIQLEEFVKTAKTSNPSEEFSRLLAKQEALKEKQLELNYQINLLSDLQIIVQSNQDVEKFIPMLEGIENPQLSESIRSLNTAIRKFQSITSKQKPTTTIYQDYESRMIQFKTSVLEIISRQIEQLNKRLSTVEAQVELIESKFLGLPSKETELTRLKRYYDLYEKFFLLLKEKRVEFGISRAGTVPEFVMLSEAGLPTTPIAPHAKNHYFYGAFLGLFLAFSLLAIKFFVQNTIMNQRDLQRLTNTPVLGVVPAYKKQKLEFSKLVVDQNPKSSISESLRSIRTNVDFLSPNKKRRLLSVTSTTSGEGKTFVAMNLAGVMAMSDYKVVVIDLDMRKPKIHFGFDAENGHGMSDLLSGQAELVNVIKKSRLKNLDFITAGTVPPNPSELILRQEFDAVIDRLFESYQVVIVDTPPVGLVTDGLLVMKKSDVPIYVVRANYSKKGIEKNLNSLYESGRFSNLSTVLNAVDISSGYGYGYGYSDKSGYGYYDDEVEAMPWWKRVLKRS